MRNVEVLVVGAGPVGAMGATRLAQMGIDVLVCEAQASCAHDLRASTFHAATIEMLDQIDAAAPLIDYGLKAPVYNLRDRKTGDTLSFDLTEIADHTPFPFRLQCEQSYMADLLAKRLVAMPGDRVMFGTSFLHAERSGDRIVATFDQGGRPIQIGTRFLVGADGARSAVRKQMDVGFDGFTYEEKFVSLSTSFPIEEVVDNLAYVNYISDPDEWLVLLRVPRLWRVLVPADGAQTDEELLSDENAASVFARIVGDSTVTTEHRTIYRVHQRVAQSFVKDRTLLVGDAAHLNNPLGGFGMNSGIHDAWNLADKLWSILRKDGGPDLLDLFDRQRRTVTRDFIQAQTISNMEQMQAGDAGTVRRAEMEAIHADPLRRRAYLMRQAMFQSLADADAIA